LKREAVMEQAEELGASFVVAGETGYPPLLSIFRAPRLLCVKGKLALASCKQLPICGAPECLGRGQKIARQLSS
jgi:predicted Rossmann fold nucleotide-binding protein DprA/Smf involved in DNA uptake